MDCSRAAGCWRAASGGAAAGLGELLAAGWRAAGGLEGGGAAAGLGELLAAAGELLAGLKGGGAAAGLGELLAAAGELLAGLRAAGRRRGFGRAAGGGWRAAGGLEGGWQGGTPCQPLRGRAYEARRRRLAGLAGGAAGELLASCA